jgi:drug/metabolite transporter (DMT)-like permease
VTAAATPGQPETVVTPPALPRVGTGASLIVAAFFLTAVMSALGKAAAGLSPATLVFFQNGIALALFLPWTLRHGPAAIKTHHLPLHLVRGVGGMLSQALGWYAVARMPLMNVVLLTNAAPLFIPLIARVWLKERVSAATWASLAIGFVGVVLILKPSPTLLKDPAAAVAVAAAACSAVALVTVNKLSATEPTSRILFYYFLIATVTTAPFLPVGWHVPTARQSAYLGAIGGCMAASQLLIILAYHYAKPAVIAPFNYSVVVFSGVIGWLFWGDVPGWLALAGVVLVTVGGVLSTATSGPAARGHFGWIGHLNLPFPHRRAATVQPG